MGEIPFSKFLDTANRLECSEDFITKLYWIEANSAIELPAINEAGDRIKRLFWGEPRSYFTKYTEWSLSECKKYGTMQSYLELLFTANEKEHFSTDVLFEYISGVEKMDRSQDNQMIEYYLKNLLMPLQNAYTNNQEKCMQIARIEISFLNVLDWSEMKCFHASIKRNPEVFSDIVSLIFRHQGDDEKRFLSDEELTYINNIYRLYDKAKFCPAEENGQVDVQRLEEWIKRFQLLLENSRQENLFGYLLGRLFSFSPSGKDAHKPCEAVRLMIENYADDSMIDEYRISVFNERGIHSPSAGKSELQIAEKFKENADFLSIKYPKTAEIYYGLYRQYKSEADRERERAENGWY
jgi:hypothetical protein